jgi:hypothetical protein
MMHKVTIVLTSAVAGGFFLFILWVIYLANTGQPSLFFDFIHSMPYGDKVGHMGLFGVLTLLTNAATHFKTFRLWRWSVFSGTALVLTFVTLEELSQYFIPSRTLDIFDYSADLAGILLFTWLSSRLANHLAAK